MTPTGYQAVDKCSMPAYKPVWLWFDTEAGSHLRRRLQPHPPFGTRVQLVRRVLHTFPLRWQLVED
jgi:hypothetical protein